MNHQEAVAQALVLLADARQNFKVAPTMPATWSELLEPYDPEAIVRAARELAADSEIEWPGIHHLAGKLKSAVREQVYADYGLTDPEEAWQRAILIRRHSGPYANDPCGRGSAEREGLVFLEAYLAAGMTDEDIQSSTMTDRGFRFRERYKAEIAKIDREIDVAGGAHRLTEGQAQRMGLPGHEARLVDMAGDIGVIE